MSAPVTSAVPEPETAALETLYEAVTRAQRAFAAVQSRIADGGTVQRIGPGAWVVTRTAPDEESAS